MGKRPQIQTKLVGYYTTKEAALFLKTSPHMTWRWASKGLLPAIDVEGRYFITKADLYAFLRPQRGDPLLGIKTARKWRAIRKARKLAKSDKFLKKAAAEAFLKTNTQ